MSYANRPHLFLLLCGLVLGAALHLPVAAQPLTTQQIPNTAGGFGAWFYGGGARVGVAGNNLAPMPTTATNPLNLSGWTKAGNYGLAPGATGVTVNSSADFSVPGSAKPVNVGVATKINPVGLGKALGNLGSKALWPLAFGSAVYDVAKELGFTLSRDQSGASVVTKEDLTNGCWTEPCFNYQVAGLEGRFTKLGACQVYESNHNTVNVSSQFVASNARVAFHEPFATDGCFVDFHRKSDGVFSSTFISAFVATPVGLSSGSPPALSSSMQEFIDAVAAKSGWPTSSAIARAAADALSQSIPVAIDPPVVSGPSSVPGPSTTTQNPDGSTTNKTITNNYTYAGDMITYNTTVTTTVINNGTVTSTTTTTSEGESPSDDLCKANPDTVGCTKLGDPAGALPEPIPREEKQISIIPEVFAAGACPAPISFTAYGVTHEFTWVEMCARLASLGTLLMALAALAAAWIFTAGFRV